MFSLFLSYTSVDSELASRIAETLRFMGIVVWMDKDNLNMGFEQEQEIVSVIENYDGIISLITPNSMKSDYVVLELKAALNILRKNDNYMIIPLIQTISFDELSKWSLNKLGDNLSSCSGCKLEETVLNDHLVEFSSKVLESLIENQNELSKIERIKLQLFSKEEQKFLDESSFIFNFRTLVDKNDMLIESKILHAFNCMKKSRDILSKTIQTKNLYVIDPKCHITLSIVFGFVFRQPSGYNLDVQHFDNLFSTNVSDPTHENILEIKEIKGSIQGNQIIYEISISNDVTSSVSNLISTEEIDYRKRINISPPDGPSRTIPFDNQLANWYADTITKSIRSQSLEYIDNTILLFLSVPLFISLLIGWNLNASGDIQLMEFHNSSKTYYKSFLLQ